jgi:acyl-CoA hydrolase
VEERTVADSRSVLVHWMGPTDANSAGFVHGGVVMKLCDEVAGLSAVRHSHRREAEAQLRRENRLAERERILEHRRAEA